MISLTLRTLTLSAVRPVTNTLLGPGQLQQWGLDKVQVQYIWTACSVREEKRKSKTVHSMDGVTMTALIQKMQELFAIHLLPHAGYKVLELKKRKVSQYVARIVNNCNSSNVKIITVLYRSINLLLYILNFKSLVYSISRTAVQSGPAKAPRHALRQQICSWGGRRTNRIHSIFRV